MSLDDLLTRPYEERQLVIFSREIDRLTTNSFFMSWRKISGDIKKHPFKSVMQQSLFRVVEFKALTALVRETFKGDKTITYLPVEDAKKLCLPTGNLKTDEIYVAHPIRSKYYYPVNEFHSSLHRQKSHELIRILESLNAVHIKVLYNRGYQDTSAFNVDVSVEQEDSANLGGGFKTTKENTSDILWDGVYDINGKEPKLPDDLVWYEHEDDWKHIVESFQKNYLKRIAFSYTYANSFGIDFSGSIGVSNNAFKAMFKKSSFISTRWEVEAEMSDPTV